MRPYRILLAFLCTLMLAVRVANISVTPLVVHAAETQGTPNTINGKPVIRVVNFNPGPGHVGNREERAIVWKDLVKYLAEQNAEVVMIQEPGKSELSTIRSAFEKQFPYSTWIRYPEGINNPEDIKRGGELNPIFSKYPFVEGTQQEWQISQDHDGQNARRIVLSKIIQTPYGNLRVDNLHTHGNTQCEDAYFALKPITEPISPFYNPPGQNFIIAGDFNIALSSATLYDPNKRNSGGILNKGVCRDFVDRGYKYADEMAEIIRLNYKTHCLDSNTCRNTGTIEMIWSLHTSPTELYKMWWGDDHFRHAFQDANKHPVVFADVGDPKWKLSASASSTKPGDLDANSVVDIFDYNILLGKFGTTGAPGFHAADIIQNGAVDIFDYNKLIENFGK